MANVSLVGADTNGGWISGGLVGWNDGSVVNCSTEGTFSGSGNVGGLIGLNYGSVINSHTSGDVTGSGIHFGGLAGSNGGSITNCYMTGTVTGKSSVGGLIGSNGGGGVVFNSFYNIDTVQINGEFNITIGGLFDEQYQDWFNNGMALDIADYNATLVPKDDHYVISNLDGFRDLLGFAGTKGLKFHLANDIDFTSTHDLYIPYLAAEFDGNHHTISNLLINLKFSSDLVSIKISAMNCFRHANFCPTKVLFDHFGNNQTQPLYAIIAI